MHYNHNDLARKPDNAMGPGRCRSGPVRFAWSATEHPVRRVERPIGNHLVTVTSTHKRTVELFPVRVSLMSMPRIRCTDRVVGAILASWRYDISGISPEMRRDYENHFVECAHCSSRQRFHRSLDATLAILTSLSALFFLFALAVLKHIRPLEHVAFKSRPRHLRHVSHAGLGRHRRADASR